MKWRVYSSSSEFSVQSIIEFYNLIGKRRTYYRCNINAREGRNAYLTSLSQSSVWSAAWQRIFKPNRSAQFVLQPGISIMLWALTRFHCVYSQCSVRCFSKLLNYLISKQLIRTYDAPLHIHIIVTNSVEKKLKLRGNSLSLSKRSWMKTFFVRRKVKVSSERREFVRFINSIVGHLWFRTVGFLIERFISISIPICKVIQRFSHSFCATLSRDHRIVFILQLKYASWHSKERENFIASKYTWNCCYRDISAQLCGYYYLSFEIRTHGAQPETKEAKIIAVFRKWIQCVFLCAYSMFTASNISLTWENLWRKKNQRKS